MNRLSPLETILRSEIERGGPMSFERFMELALYHPEHGYYERGCDQTGRTGDFYTSVSVGSMFGRLLAARFRDWFASAAIARGTVVEAGAHDGRLAADVLRAADAWLTAYWIVEPSPRREAAQRAALQQFVPKVRWARSFEELRAALDGPGLRGAIFSNELLDALPVRRLGWDAGRGDWFEWAVEWNGSRFEFGRTDSLRGSPPAGVKWEWLCNLPAPLRAAIPDGFTVEAGISAENWWTAAASVLERGWLLGIDYGFETEGCLAAERAEGTLRGYRAHRLVADVLETPGGMDLTASVDFGALRVCGERTGLRTCTLQNQEAFLAESLRLHLASGTDPCPTPADRRQLQTLLHPGHLGRAFRALIQTKGIPAPGA